MIRTVLALKPKPGLTSEVVELFKSERILERALSVEGCRRVEVWSGSEEVLVMGTWANSRAYQAWLAHPERNASNDALNALLDEPISATSRSGSYTLALSGGPLTEDS